ncbi:capsular biosynthesis protein [Magnetofaba australis]|uniref:capsular biosynthesis protein n=1 Tax=Magnetofaba australis TaxID=1472297 RepID=UPI0039C9C18B
MQKEKCIVCDIDGTLCPTKRADQSYADLIPYPAMAAQLRAYKEAGFTIILHTARNMRTHEGNIGLINANTAKFTLAWLDQHQIPYDEIHFGKPWQGRGGFYVDDNTIRPDEFLNLSYEEIQTLLAGCRPQEESP